MSASAIEGHASKHRCACNRRATYRTQTRGAGRHRHAKTDHPLCERCWRALIDRYRKAPPAAHRWLADELLALVLIRSAVAP